MKRWKINVEPPIGCKDIEFTCMGCGTEALLPVIGSPIAQVGAGLIGDQHAIDMPDQIKCPTCGTEYERDDTPTR